MGGAKGSALEWALALHRAPMERHALRQKPLPTGLDNLLGIAAGAMPDALSEAAHAFGESEAKVREAAQFYVREVLFFPQANAYRVLGVAADASAEQIKAHHRVLQHWLHPDRLQSEGDAVFAARVNGAWNRLRNPERRQAYDQALQQNRPPEVFDSNGLPRSVHAWVANPETHPPRWPGYLPMLVLLLACLVLILFVARDMSRSPDLGDWLDRGESASAGDMLVISVPQRADPQPAQSHARTSTKPRPSPKSVATTRESTSRKPASPAPTSLRPPASRERIARMAPPMPAALAALGSKPAKQTRTSRRTTQPATRRGTHELPVEEPTQLRPSLSPASSAPTPGFTKIQLARQTGDQFLRYMGTVNVPPPPIWNSPAIQSSADSLRQELHGEGRARLGAIKWRIGNQAAVLSSAYTMQGDSVGNGLLMADLVWRDGHWLVTGLSMERAK